MYDLRNMLANENGPDPDAVHQVFVDAMEARARWQAGIVTTLDRVSGPSTEIPTFAESMGEMFIGRRGMEAQKKLFNSSKDDQSNKS